MKPADVLRQLFCIIALPLFCGVVFMLFSAMLVANKPITRETLFIIQTITEIGVFLIPALLFIFLFRQQYPPFWKSFTKTNTTQIPAMLLLMLVSLPLVALTKYYNELFVFPESLSYWEAFFKKLENEAMHTTELLLNVHSISGLMANLFIAALIPAITEEFFFRGIVQKCLLKCFKNRAHLSVWITAIIFSSIHFQFYGFIPRAILGALLGYIFLYSGSIWLAVIAHFFNNALAVISYFISINYTLPVKENELQQPYLLLTAGCLSLIFCILIIKDMRKKSILLTDQHDSMC